MSAQSPPAARPALRVRPDRAVAGAPRVLWVTLHAASATLLLLLVAAHVLRHWPWVRHALRRRLGRGVPDGAC